MCGIVGIWEFGTGHGRVDLPLVERMRDTMVHRGPDDARARLFDGGRGGFGFRRLSIVDLSPAGGQPMSGCGTRDVLLVFNGEIYNHRNLRPGLEERGHQYHSETDSETIIHSYEELGAEMVHEIEGDFAVAIWDGEKRQLSLFRDRMGVKPLYFYMAEGRIIFASEIKAILEHPSVKRDVDELALYDYLTFLTTPAPRTLFKGIEKLPAGHRLVVNGSGDVRVERYWDPLPAATVNTASETEQCETVLGLLRSSIRKRMMADVPFGVFLSGGVDSSANVALMSEVSDAPVRTFTVGFKDHEYLNELDAARRIAQRYGTDHHEVIIGDREFDDFLPDLIFHQDEPIADPVCVPLYYVSKLARETGTIVVQVGEGADEILSGYSKYVANLHLYQRFWRHAAAAPGPVKNACGSLMQTLAGVNAKGPLIADLGRRLKADEPMFWGSVVVFDETMKPRLLTRGFRERMGSHTSLNAVRHLLDRVAAERPDSDFLSRMTYVELKLRLPELLLMRVDKIAMAASVEARVPFLDHHVVEYAMSLPQTAKVRGRTGKHVLKRSLESILPHDLLYAKKRGFGAPVKEWFRGDAGRALIDKLVTSAIHEREYFNLGYIREMALQHESGRRDMSFHLWALVNLAMWYDRWIS